MGQVPAPPVSEEMTDGEPQTKRPARIGVLLGDLGEVNTVALKYLVVHLNALQTAVEFELLPAERTDPVLELTRSKERINRDALRNNLPAFVERTRAFLSRLNDGYRLTQTVVPDKFVLLTMARFSDNWYSLSGPGIRVLALGDWERHMAPPSLLEFFVTLTLRQAIALIAPSLSGSVHLATKGCLFDFTSSLDDVRLKALQGFVCHECRAALVADGHVPLADQLVPVLDTSRWFGKMEDPTTPAGIVSNLGYDLFRTRGIRPTFWEKTLALLREEGVKELIKVVGGIILAGLLLWLGLKKG